VTEVLFQLGLGDRVVGVTRFCRFPPEAQQRPKVGGQLDPGFEAVLALRPDLVVGLVEQRAWFAGLDKLGVPHLAVCHQDLQGILESLTAIGRRCGAEQNARQLRREIEARLSEIQQRTAARPPPRVLVVVDRHWGAGRIEDPYVAGSNGHLSQAIRLAGGRNVAASAQIPVPVVSPELMLTLKPDLIVDLVPERELRRLGEKRLRADWQSLEQVGVVAADRVVILSDDRALLPGPHVVDLVERLARLFHPELDWEPSGRP